MGESESDDVRAIVRVFADVVRTFESSRIPYLAIGSVAASAWGALEWPRAFADVDFLLAEPDVASALRALEADGFHTERPPEEDWLAKAHRDGVLVDVIFRAAGNMRLDHNMLSHGQVWEISGVPVRVCAPEDFALMQATSLSRETADHLFNGAAVLRSAAIAWDYLESRAAGVEGRLLALLLYARSEGVAMPHAMCERLLAASRERTAVAT
ncbi:MAG: nucleotidyltransferase [Actinomycetota bacterium]|nr:nucleotidyltransferase family protein [Actinomycetota bacterium]